MKTKAIEKDLAEKIFAKMRPGPALVCETMLRYGLRVSDVVDWRVEDLQKGRWFIHEKKRGKKRRISCTGEYRERLLRISRGGYVFPGRKPFTHITRQAVWCSFRTACRRTGVEGAYAPHSLRKTHARIYYSHYGVEATRKHLNHDDISTTLIYLFDE